MTEWGFLSTIPYYTASCWLCGTYLDSRAGSENELCSAAFSELLVDDELRLLSRDWILFLEEFRLFNISALTALEKYRLCV